MTDTPEINQKLNISAQRQLMTLVKMQLKEQLGGSRRDTRSLLFSVIYFIIAAIIITAIAYAVFAVGVFVNLLSLINGFIRPELIIFVFAVLILSSLFTVAVGLAKSLFLSKDNVILATLPVEPHSIFLSKIICYYILELRRFFLYIMPIFIAFGLYNGYSWPFYIIIFPTFIVISLFTVTLGSILSIPIMWVILIFQRHRFLQVLSFLGLFILVGWLMILLIRAVPSEIDVTQMFAPIFFGLESFLLGFARIMRIFGWLTGMVIGRPGFGVPHTPITLSGIITFGVLIVLIIILVIVIWYGVKSYYLKMIANTSDHYSQRIQKKSKKNHRNLRFLTTIKKELLLNFRKPATFVQNFILLFVLPFAIVLLNRVFYAMNTRLLGVHISIAFNVFIMLVIILPNNAYAASIISSEGDAAYLDKAKSVSMAGLIYSKLFLNYILSILSVLVTATLMARINAIPLAHVWYMFAVIVLLLTGHLLWSIDFDLINPKYDLYKDRQKISTNPNEVKSVIAAFVIAFVAFGYTLLLLLQADPMTWIRMLIGSSIFFLVRIYLNVSRLKVFNRVEVIK